MTEVAPDQLTRELRLSEARYRTLVVATALDVWRTDAEGSVITDLPNWRAYTEQIDGAVEGWGWLDGVRASERDRVRDRWLHSIATGEPYECEYAIVSPDGDERLVLSQGYPLVEDGRVLEWIGVVTDVTEQRRATQRLADLQRMTAGLAAAKGVNEVAQLTVLGCAEALKCDRTSLLVLEPDGTSARMVASIGFDDDFVRRFELIGTAAEYPGLDALRHDEIVVLSSPEEWRRRYPHLTGADHRSTTVVAAPLRVGTQPFGVLTFGWDASRPPNEPELSYIDSIADLAAQALDRALIYERERETSRTLQQSFLPPIPPEVPGMEVASRYRPGVHTLAVGGDFYDVFPLSTNAWGLAIGDVCGKGAQAAGLTALARFTIRSAAAHNEDPADVLRELNDAVLRDSYSDGRFCSAVFARLELDRCGAWLTIACGGHPRPYVVRKAGWVDLRGHAGILLGLFPTPEVSDDLVGLGPGDSVVMLTDGITEARDQRGEMFAEEVLAEVLMTGCDLSADDLAESIMAAAQGFAGGELRDDAAVLVVRVPPNAADDPAARLRSALGDGADSALPGYPLPWGDPSKRPAPPREARCRLAADLSSIAGARRFVTGVIHSWRLSEMADGDAELLVSELATNAVRHAASAFTIVARSDGERLRVEVGDGSRELPTRRTPGIQDTSGRGILLVDELASAWGVVATATGKRVWYELTIPPGIST